GQALALDLGEDHRAVVHGDRAFREPQAFGDQLDIHGSRSLAFVLLGGTIARMTRRRPDWREGRPDARNKAPPRAPSTTALRAAVPLPRSASLTGQERMQRRRARLSCPAQGGGDRPAQPGGGGGATAARARGTGWESRRRGRPG